MVCKTVRAVTVHPMTTYTVVGTLGSVTEKALNDRRGLDTGNTARISVAALNSGVTVSHPLMAAETSVLVSYSEVNGLTKIGLVSQGTSEVVGRDLVGGN
jgi:hypothetical protein